MSNEGQRRLLIIEDDPGLQSQMRWCFDAAIEVSVADDFESAIAAFRREAPQVVTLDLGLPPDPGGASVGFALLTELLRLDSRVKVIVITGREEHEHAVNAVARGAYDFYQKPVDADTLTFVTDRAFRLHELERENERLQLLGGGSRLAGIIATSPSMMSVCRIVERVAPTDVTTLILGETGTGKEVIARAVHNLSTREKQPFVALNCAAIPETLLESELFGYEKGAFTGATAQKKGRIEHANGGTLFLDEIGDMPLPLQAKMLRFLQERQVERIGGRDSIAVDVRVVCATHRDLQKMIGEGSFREDLYYRISEITVKLPPVREREGDILLLANTLLRRFCQDLNRPVLKFSTDAVAAMEQWRWPGNVREMENRLKRAVILADGMLVSASDLELATADGEPMPFNLREVRDLAERQAVVRALTSSTNNVAQAARLLGVTRPTLYNLINKFHIELDD